jgi:hypothetical protein
MNSLISALLIALVPAMAVLVLWFFLKNGAKSKKELYFLLGFLAITLFYIFAPDPSLIYKLYTGEGDVGPVWIFSIFALIFLAVSVFIFKAYRRA